MLIDIIFVALMVMAVFKGYSRGLLVAVFSLLALVVGLAAALKLSVLVAGYLKDSLHVGARWLPIIAFLLVFLTAVWLVRLAARALEKAVQWALLGWVNRLGGILLYICLYLVIYSVLLFYATRMGWVSATTISESKTYGFIEPWGPKLINGIGSVVPLFSNMFHELEDFFARLSEKISLR